MSRVVPDRTDPHSAGRERAADVVIAKDPARARFGPLRTLPSGG